MKSDRALVVCGVVMLGACLLAGCGHSDAGDAGPAAGAKAAEVPAGMPPEVQQQYLQSRSTPPPAVPAAEQKGKP